MQHHTQDPCHVHVIWELAGIPPKNGLQARAQDPIVGLGNVALHAAPPSAPRLRDWRVKERLLDTTPVIALSRTRRPGSSCTAQTGNGRQGYPANTCERHRWQRQNPAGSCPQATPATRRQIWLPADMLPTQPTPAPSQQHSSPRLPRAGEVPLPHRVGVGPAVEDRPRHVCARVARACWRHVRQDRRRLLVQPAGHLC